MKRYSDKEREAYRRGKIIAYYQNKKKQKRASPCSSKPPSKVKYGNYDANEAFRKALERTYGPTVKDD